MDMEELLTVLLCQLRNVMGIDIAEEVVVTNAGDSVCRPIGKQLNVCHILALNFIRGN